MNLIKPYSAGRGEQSARAASDPHAYCGTRGTFRTRSQRSARVLRHAGNTPRAQPTIRKRRKAPKSGGALGNQTATLNPMGRIPDEFR